jgi:hypothetical protein
MAADGQAVVWTRPLTPSELTHKPRLIATTRTKAKPARRPATIGLTASR